MSSESIRPQVEALEKEILQKKQQLAELRHQLEPEPIRDYPFKDWNGKTVLLSDLFGAKDEMILVHNMGKRCPYCTMWADGFNGLRHHLSDRAAFLVVSPDEPEIQKAFAQGRDWRFPMVSCAETTFAKDLKFMDDKGAYWPGVSALYKSPDGKIFRSAYTFFGPSDDFCSTWHFFDLLKNRANDWHPQYEY